MRSWAASRRAMGASCEDGTDHADAPGRRAGEVFHRKNKALNHLMRRKQCDSLRIIPGV
jgi:hypothetical protein